MPKWWTRPLRLTPSALAIGRSEAPAEPVVGQVPHDLVEQLLAADRVGRAGHRVGYGSRISSVWVSRRIVCQRRQPA